ncbi:MAG TPA: ATP-binding cassette domain-containing protein [Dehalococcoidia bacterium]|nr:ATP-binding cassette domain-containing protein [Dehalococcoidia bacterium]
MHAIETERLRKEYDGEIVAVAGIDLEVEEGQVFAFLGPNGAGKTTTVRMLTTLLRPTSGRASVAGLDVYRQQHEIRRSIGVALQEAGLDALATGRELLELQGKLCGLSSETSRRRAGEMLDLVGLTDAAERQVKTYSGGMKRRLDLASALVHEPRILFLDEPTEGLDPASRQSVWQEVQRLNQQMGMTVFLTTHYLEEADRLADRVAIIDHGNIVAEGTPAELKATIGTDVVTVAFHDSGVEAAKPLLAEMPGLREMRPEASSVTLFVDNGTQAVAQVIRILDGAGIEMAQVAVAHPSLDEVFLKATGSRLEGAETAREEKTDGNR